jgi:hypothetical protein
MSGAVYYVKAPVRKHLLPFILIPLVVVLFGCTQVVTLPVRTVIDLTNPLIRVEADSTIDLVDDAKITDKVSP